MVFEFLVSICRSIVNSNPTDMARTCEYQLTMEPMVTLSLRHEATGGCHWQLSSAEHHQQHHGGHSLLDVFKEHNTQKLALVRAGCDILLMPSRFEPCGLNQLFAMRYGTIPIAHATGGLRDTIQDYSPYASGEQPPTLSLFLIARIEGEHTKCLAQGALITTQIQL